MEYTAEELLTTAVRQNASDIFLIPGRPFSCKIEGRIICRDENKIFPDEMDEIIKKAVNETKVYTFDAAGRETENA